ncbi:MAG: ferrous iron transport protein B [Deltaproteobacteria bacterium]|nr:ferrous iron transport protein B [Deltaproteobacteria bacterium]
MHEHKKTKIKEEGERLILVGNPNVGKSVIFGALTGRYVTVSNYPGTTVEVTRGSASIGGRKYIVIDTPGVNSLVPMSEDERVTRDILLNERTDSVIQVADTKNLRRSLLISLQLAEIGIPFSLALNMIDEARSKGWNVDTDRLSETLGIDVIPTIATQRQGIDNLVKTVSSQRPSHFKAVYGADIEEAIQAIGEFLPETFISGRAIALMLLSGDETLNNWLHKNVSEEAVKNIEDIRYNIQSGCAEPLGYMLNIERLKMVDRIVADVVTMEPASGGRIALFLGKWSMHPIAGVPILFAVLYLMYVFVGQFGAGTSVNFLEKIVFGEYLNPWASRVVKTIIPVEIIQDIMVGQYGLITMAFTYAIAIILPIVGYFFIFFGLLEDSGYLPRLAVMVDKIFKIIGLNGKAVLPMVLGLGCDTMATMTTRILETKKERIIVTLLLALGVPCSAQLGVILGMLAGVSFKATLWWGGVVVFTMLLVGFFASKVVPGEASDFLLEIPPIRVPKFSNILIKTLVRVEWYLREAVPLFILGTLFLFIMDKISVLNIMERIASPVVVDFLDLPAKATEAFIVGFLRRDYGAAGLFALQKDGMLNPIQVVTSLVTMTLFVPCIANFFMIVKERGLMTAVWMSAFIFPFAVLVGGALNFILRALEINL